MPRIATTHDYFVSRLVAYAKNSEPDESEFVVPEDLATLDDEALAALHEQAVENFNALYGEPEDRPAFSDDDLKALGDLTDAIERIGEELNTREAANAERADRAAALAARVNPKDESEESEDDEDEDEDDAPQAGEENIDEAEEDDAEDEAPVEEQEPALVAAGRRGETRVNLRGIARRQKRGPKPDRGGHDTMRDFAHAADVPGFAMGQGMNWDDIGKALDRRLNSYNHGAYAQAAKSGKRVKDQAGVVNLSRRFDEALTIKSSDPSHVESVIQHAIDQKRLPQGSLVASGGWCAPSETLYGLCELESDDGMLSVPEVSVARGGIKFTTGPAWSDIYGAVGFDYSEQDNIDGNFGVDADGVGDGTEGDKPCYAVPCPDFEEVRLRTAGVCIQAGLLQARGYPEVLARVTRGALTAYRHKMNARVIASMVGQSDAVAMTAGTVGTTAPLLTAIELQVEHYKYVNRMSRNAVLEAVFPYWVRGAIRSDLALRLGVDLLSVTNAQIDGWFRERGVSVQFVYDWQDITGDASAFTTWPTEVTFLLYSAGTFLKGTSDVVSIDTMYDSTLLAQNDFTALFMEEGYFVAKTCDDARAVTVPVCSDGSTHAGVLIECDGTETAGV